MRIKKLLALLLISTLAYGANAQCNTDMCDLNGRFSTSNIRVLGQTPGKITVGKKAQISITAENTGTCKWTSGCVFMRVTLVGLPSGASSMGSSQREELVPSGDLKIGDPVDRGKSETFVYDISIDAPSASKPVFPTGEYTLEFVLVNKGKPFGPKVRAQVEVTSTGTKCTEDAELYDRNIEMPDKMNPNDKETVTVTVKNSGTCSWNSDDMKLRVKYVSLPPGSTIIRDKFVPGDGYLDLDNETTEAGKTASFRYNIVAPKLAGTYILEWQMLSKGKPFGSKCQKRINVVEDLKDCAMECRYTTTGFQGQKIMGKTQDITIKVENYSECDWAASAVEIRFKLNIKPSGSTVQIRDLVPGNGTIVISKNIPKGGYINLNWDMKIPYKDGNYQITWQAYDKQGKAFGQPHREDFKIIAPK